MTAITSKWLSKTYTRDGNLLKTTHYGYITPIHPIPQLMLYRMTHCMVTSGYFTRTFRHPSLHGMNDMDIKDIDQLWQPSENDTY